MFLTIIQWHLLKCQALDYDEDDEDDDDEEEDQMKINRLMMINEGRLVVVGGLSPDEPAD